MTRKEFAKILDEIFVFDDKFSSANTYTDVGLDNPYYESISRVRLLKGYPDGSFRPDNYITRAEACVIFNRLPKTQFSFIQGVEFSDVDSKAWYAESVNKAAEFSLIVGYPDGSFRPNDNLTKREVAMVLKRILLNI